MAPDPSGDLPAAHRAVTARPVARRGQGRLPALLAPDPAAERRVIEFFTAHIRNPRARKGYTRAAAGFAAWAKRHGIAHLRDVDANHERSSSAALCDRRND